MGKGLNDPCCRSSSPSSKCFPFLLPLRRRFALDIFSPALRAPSSSSAEEERKRGARCPKWPLQGLSPASACACLPLTRTAAAAAGAATDDSRLAAPIASGAARLLGVVPLLHAAFFSETEENGQMLLLHLPPPRERRSSAERAFGAWAVRSIRPVRG